MTSCPLSLFPALSSLDSPTIASSPATADTCGDLNALVLRGKSTINIVKSRLTNSRKRAHIRVKTGHKRGESNNKLLTLWGCMFLDHLPMPEMSKSGEREEHS